VTFLLPPHERIQRAVAFWQRIEQKALTGAPLDQADADEIALLQIGGIDVESQTTLLADNSGLLVLLLGDDSITIEVDSGSATKH
jgi:hypothetical protein